MQGAALKLTALAASLAVGFVVLMQVQQGLDSPRQALISPDDVDSGFDESGVASQFAPQTLDAVGDPLANGNEQTETDFQPAISLGQSETLSPAQFESPTLADSRPAGTPLPVTGSVSNSAVPVQDGEDPFAVFSRQLNDRVQEGRSELQAQQQLLQEKMTQASGQTQAPAEGLTQKIELVGHEVEQGLGAARNAFAEQASPVMQAVSESVEQLAFPGQVTQNEVENAGLKSPEPMRLELAQGPSRKAGGFAPFTGETPAAPEKKSAAVEGFPAAAFPPADNKPESSEQKNAAEEPKSSRPTASFPATEKTDTPPARTASQDAIPDGSPRQPQPAGFPKFQEQSLEQSDPQPQPGLMRASSFPAADGADPTADNAPSETPAPSKAPAAFFEDFAAPGSDPNKAEDGPYRLVPQFNRPEMDENTSKEPAPFQFTPEEISPQGSPSGAIGPGPLPVVTPQGSEAPLTDPPLAAEGEGLPGFPAMPAPGVSSAANPFAVPPADSSTPATFEGSKPADPPAQPDNPFGGNPIGAIEKPAPATFPGIEPPATNTPEESEKPQVGLKPQTPLSDEELIGAAKVNSANMESTQQPKIELYKSAPENAVLGQPLIYSIEVVNTGDVSVKDVTVEDQFPAGTKLTGTIPRAELVEKTLVWKFPELKPSERKKILVRVVPIEPGNIGSISTVSYKSVVATQTLVTAPRLELAVQTAAEFAVGEAVPLKFILSNSGQGEANDVILRNVIPAGLEHPAGADLEYEIGSLKGGETKEVTLVLTAKQAGEFANQSSVRSSGGLSLETETLLKVIPAVMTLTQTGPTRRFVGHATPFEVLLTNNSQRTLEQVRVIEQIPEGFEFQSASAKGVYNRTDNTVSWVLQNVASGQEVKLGVTLIPRQTGASSLVLQAEDQQGHRVEVKHQVKIEGFASLAVRVPDERGPVAKGERVSLRFKVLNRGSVAASGVQVKCSIPAQLTYVSSDGPVQGEPAGQTILFSPVPSLGANQELTFDLVFTAAEAGDARVDFEVSADTLSAPIRHQEQVLIYGD